MPYKKTKQMSSNSTGLNFNFNPGTVILLSPVGESRKRSWCFFNVEYILFVILSPAFNKRWCVLRNGSLSYQENEKVNERVLITFLFLVIFLAIFCRCPSVLKLLAGIQPEVS